MTDETREAAAALQAEAEQWPDLPQQTYCHSVRRHLNELAAEATAPHVAKAFREAAHEWPTAGTTTWAEVRKELAGLADEITASGL